MGLESVVAPGLVQAIMRGKKTLLIYRRTGHLTSLYGPGQITTVQAVAASVSETSRTIGGPAYEVQVEMPLFNSGRAPWEIPGVILGYSDRGPRLDQASPGAYVGKIAPDHLELSAEGGWDLLIETNRERRIAQGTHVAFPVKLGERPLQFNCRPADPPVGYLHTNTRTGSDELEGSFQFEITSCKNAISGKTAAWPYQPLKVSGSFAGLRKSKEN